MYIYIYAQRDIRSQKVSIYSTAWSNCIFSHPTHLYIARRLCAIVWRERDRDAEGASFEDIVQELVGQVEFFNSQRNRCFLWSIDWRAHF